VHSSNLASATTVSTCQARATVHIGLGVETFLWPHYEIGQAIIFLPCGFFLSFFLRLISAVADWMSTILLKF